MNSNNDNIEEVPLDLFDQVSIEESDDSIEIMDLSNESNDEPKMSENAISISADAYRKIMEARNNASNSQQEGSN